MQMQMLEMLHLIEFLKNVDLQKKEQYGKGKWYQHIVIIISMDCLMRM